MERKELQYIPIRSQSQQRVRELAVLVSCGGWLRGRHGGGNWGNDGDCTECFGVLEKSR